MGGAPWLFQGTSGEPQAKCPETLGPLPGPVVCTETSKAWHGITQGEGVQKEGGV